MGSFNEIIVSERHQRPSFNAITLLRSEFIKSGGYLDLDEAQVSSVMLFRKAANTSPSSLLDCDSGLVTDVAASSAIWRWTVDGVSNLFLTEAEFSRSNDISASSIFQVDEGRFAVVLNGLDDVSSIRRNGTIINSLVNLSGEPVGRYLDVWTVKPNAASDWVTYINETVFYQDNISTLTQPLLVSTRHSLYNKRVYLGSVAKLKIGTEITIENKDIDTSVRNTLKGGLIPSGSIEIKKHNEDSNLPSWVTVSSHADTQQLTDVTSDCTFVLDFDTANLTNGTIQDLGNARGTYSVRLKYSILEETLVSPPMYFSIT